MTHVFIVGSKGIPAQYGGFETFVENLTAGKQSKELKYHVSCMNNDEKHFEHNDADCFNVRVPLPGAPGRIFHVGLVLNQVEKWAKQHPHEKVIVCILGCRIGAFADSARQKVAQTWRKGLLATQMGWSGSAVSGALRPKLFCGIAKSVWSRTAIWQSAILSISRNTSKILMVVG